MLLHNANINKQGGPNNDTALHIAAEKADLEAITMLSIDYWNADKAIKNSKGETPEMIATINSMIINKDYSQFARAFSGLSVFPQLSETNVNPESENPIQSPRLLKPQNEQMTNKRNSYMANSSSSSHNISTTRLRTELIPSSPLKSPIVSPRRESPQTKNSIVSPRNFISPTPSPRSPRTPTLTPKTKYDKEERLKSPVDYLRRGRAFRGNPITNTMAIETLENIIDTCGSLSNEKTEPEDNTTGD